MSATGRRKPASALQEIAMITFSSVLFAAAVATLVVRWVNAGGWGDTNRPAGA
jgi:hypothetical protein